MENYIEINLLSILNQSFQKFEIIIINDFSNDNTENIIKRIQKEDYRIKLINPYLFNINFFFFLTVPFLIKK